MNSFTVIKGKIFTRMPPLGWCQCRYNEALLTAGYQAGCGCIRAEACRVPYSHTTTKERPVAVDIVTQSGSGSSVWFSHEREKVDPLC